MLCQGVDSLIKKSKGIALLIDADLIAYRSAAVCEERSVDVLHKSSGRVRNFSTRTTFKEFLKAKSYDYVKEDYVFTDLQEATPVANALHTVKSQIKSFEDKFKPKITRIVLSGSNNFRDNLPLPKKYKSNRKDTIRPLLLNDCREYLKTVKGAEVIEGSEADDHVIVLGYAYKSKGYDVVIATIDKDANAYSDLMVWNFTDIESEPVLIPKLGYLKQVDGKVKGVGFLWYCFQMLLGDTTDFYRPFEVVRQKIGDVHCFNLLKDCRDEKTALEVVVAEYKRLIPDDFQYNDWGGVAHIVNHVDWLCLYHRCVRMQSVRDDPLNFVLFAKEYGVTL